MPVPTVPIMGQTDDVIERDDVSQVGTGHRGSIVLPAPAVPVPTVSHYGI